MMKFKRVAAALAASAMMFTMSGCTDTRYAMTCNNGEKINAGVYIYNLYSEMSYQMTMAYYTSGAAEIDLNSDYEGQKLGDYLVEQARKSTKEYAAITYQFEKLGLKLTEDDEKTISDSVKNTWEQSSELLEEEGISKESVRKVMTAQTMRTKLFDYYYAADGVEAVTDDDLKQYVEENYIKYKAIRISKSDAEDETAAAEENKENEAVRDAYLAKAKGISYDDFDMIIDEYDEYAKAKMEAEASAEEDSADTGSGSIGPSLGEGADVTVDAPADDDGLEEAEVLDDADAVALDEIVTADETATAEESNPNETMYNYGGMDDETKESSTGKLAEFIHGMEYDKAVAYDDDSFYYIIIRGDVSTNSAEYAVENHDSLVQTMKADDFQAKIDSWIDEVGVKENSDAIRKYTAQAIYDKQNDYYSKHQ